jgi:hypothetical protein
MQMNGSVREYKLNGSRIYSILSDAKKYSSYRPKLDTNDDYLLRVKIDPPLLQMQNTLAVVEFGENGLSALGVAKSKSRKKWSPFTEPKHRHRWPAFSSIAAFLASLSDERVDSATKKTVELIFHLNKNCRSSGKEGNSVEYSDSTIQSTRLQVSFKL